MRTLSNGSSDLIHKKAPADSNEITGRADDSIDVYLKRPYARMVLPEPDGSFRGEILEFPGCIATGDTPAEALSSLEEVAKGWLAAAMAHAQNIPEPVEAGGFSGKMVLRLPK